MKTPTSEEKLILLFLADLERISVDSYWAHRAGGSALMKLSEQMEIGVSIGPAALNNNFSISFQILKEAAKARSLGPLRF